MKTQKLMNAVALALMVVNHRKFTLLVSVQTDVRAEPLPWWKRWSREVAVSSKGSPIIIRTHYLERATVPELVGTIVHESLHVAGWKHARWWPVDRSDLGYSAGRMAQAIAEELV